MKLALIIFLVILGFCFLFFYDFYTPPQQEQSISLASSFLQGKLYFLSSWHDTADYAGYRYWPLGPFPSVLLMPFVFIFGNSFKQGYLLFFLNILNFFLLLRIARKIGGNIINSTVISFAVIFSTAYLGLALVPWSWYFAQSVGFSLILLALEAYFFKRSWLLIGIYLSLAYATRISLIFISTFFILNLFSSDLSNKFKIKKFFLLVLPVIISLGLIGIYNYVRFGTPIETGYSYQKLDGPVGVNRTFGLWSIYHIPYNVYSMFLKIPSPIFTPETQIMEFPYIQVDGSGLSILFTSFIFIWILFSNWKELNVKSAGITSLILIVVLSGSFTNGGWQYGYRYAIDFYPMLFVILLYSFKTEVSYKFLFISVAGFLMNLYFIDALFYP